VSRDDDVGGGEIETPVSFVVSRVSKENTSGGPGCQFVSGFDEEIRIAGATKHAQVLIGGGDSMEGDVRTGRVDRLCGEVVQQICGGVESFYPVASWKRSLKKQETQHIVDGANDTLDFIVLRRSVRIRHPQKYTFDGEECMGGGIIELTTIVALDSFDGATKLCEDICEKCDKVKNVKFNV
jgi:hypothetical protein